MRECIVGTLAEAEAAARAIEGFLIAAQDAADADEILQHHLWAIAVQSAAGAANDLVLCLLRLRRLDERRKEYDRAQTT